MTDRSDAIHVDPDKVTHGVIRTTSVTCSSMPPPTAIFVNRTGGIEHLHQPDRED